MQFVDNIFDQQYLHSLSYKLLNSRWDVRNIANRNTYPSGEHGTHRLLGFCSFLRDGDNDKLHYDSNIDFT